MGTLADDFNDENLRGRTLRRIAHGLPVLLTSVLAIRLAFFVFPESKGLAFADLFAVYMLFVTYVFFMIHIELTRICVRCMKEVPDKAPIRAQQFHALLWFTHTTWGWRRQLTCTCGVVLTSLGMDRLGVPEFVPDLTLTAYFILLFYGFWFHHRVRPWCRYCPRWDNGGGITEPSPDPVARGTRV